jgi:hypothetical protein
MVRASAGWVIPFFEALISSILIYFSAFDFLDLRARC